MISKPVQFEHDPFNPPQLVYDDAVKPLSPEAEALLQRVFSDYEQVDIPQELGGGFTQSRVLVAQPVRRDGGADLPLVLKVGPTWLIEQEQAGYTRYIRDKLAGRIELVTVELSETWGVLGYRLAGDGHFKHESLARYCRQTESQVLAEMLTDRLFKRLGTLWQNADVWPEPYPATKYDLLLPVQVVIEPQALPLNASMFEVTPERLTPDHLVLGDAVRLAGFIITEVDPEAQEVTLDLPAKTGGPSRSHRLRLQPVDAVERYRVGEPMPLVEGRVVQTRRGRLQAEIDRILDPSTELELTADRLRLADGGILPNPLAHLSALLSDWPAVKLAYQHGDLNLENVLVDPATRDVTLIDFANAGLEHVLHDLLHLEMSVVTSLLAEALVEVGETPELIGPVFYDRLRRATVDDPALYTPPRLLQPALKKVYTILAAIRQIAQAYLTNPNDWDEYYRGLALYLVGALKFKDLDQVPAAPYPKQLALVGAAQAVALWQQPEVRPVPTVDLSPVTAELQMALAGTGFDLSRETLLLPDETSLLNPITQLPDLLESWIGTRWDRVHGRFDLATLVSELESDANALIEAEVGPDERLHHLLRLETGVVVGLLPPALIEADQPPETIRFLIYERLHRAVMGDPAQFALPRAIHPALAQPYALLAAIRRQTARFLTSEAAWAEYYRGLVFYLLGVLRLVDSDDPPSIPPKGGEEKLPLPEGEGWGEGQPHLTFLTAAIATDLWHNATPRPHPPTPYLGLHAFQEADAPFFFGRDAFVDQLVATIPHRPLLAVTGASGSGKSSVVLAGLLPRLRQAGDWLPVTVRPGSAPFEELAQALVPLIERRFSDDLVHTWAETLRQGQQTLADLLNQRLLSTPKLQHLLLIIDQFEELYTLCPDPDTRTRFIDTLLVSGQGPGIRNQGVDADDQHSPTSQPPNLQSSITIILTLRADFIGKALTHRPLADALRGNIELLSAMNRTELAQAIEYPAEKLGISFEAGLVERILDDVGDEPGHLPLLEFALTQLWQRQSNGRLTWNAYEMIGRVPGAVTHYAEQVYTVLTPDQQSQARHIFTQLVQPGAGTEDTRRVAHAAELEADWPLVQQLAGSRLVITNRDAGGSEIVEVVHEALIQNWERLGRWMEGDRTFRAWQERLRAALNQWQATDWDEGGLIRGATLAEAEAWLAQRPDDLSQREQDFILRSVTLREQQQAAAEVERQRQLAQAQALAEEQRQRAEEQTEAADKLRRRALGLGTALLLLLLAILGVIIFYRFWTGAEELRTVAERQAAEADIRRATALSAAQAAERRQSTAEWSARAAQTAEAQAVLAEATAVSARVNADVDRQKALSLEQTAGAARQVAQTQQAQAEQNEGQAVAAQQTALAERATAEAAEIVAQQAQQTAQANQATAQAQQAEAEAAAEAAQQAQTQAETARQVAETRQAAAQAQQAEAEAAAASARQAQARADAARQAAEQARNTAEAARKEAEQRTGEARKEAERLERLNTSRQLATQALRSLDDAVYDLALLLSLEANRIGPTLEANQALLTGLQQSPTYLRSHSREVENVAFSPEGPVLASSSWDNTIKLWRVSDAERPELLSTLFGHNDVVYSVVFDPDGQVLASGSGDSTIKLWDVSDPEWPELFSTIDTTQSITSVAFSPDGQVLVSSDGRLWRVSDPTHPEELSTIGADGVTLAFSPDGQVLASSDGRLWRVSDPTQPELLSTIDTSEGIVAFSPNGQLLVLRDAERENAINLWDVRDPQQPKKLSTLIGHRFSVLSVSFSPDGQMLASGGTVEKTINLWRVSDPEKPELLSTLTSHIIDVISMAFSSDGQVLASGSWDGIITVWDVSGPKPPGAISILTGHRLSATDVAFSPNGLVLASSSDDNTIKLWQVSDSQELNTIDTGDGSTSVAFSPNGQVLASGSWDNTIKLWDVSDPKEVELLSTIGANNEPTSVAFSPDGQVLASGSWDRIKLWDVTDPKEVELLSTIGASNETTSVAFSPDGQVLASGSWDNTIKLWDVSDPKEVKLLSTLTGHSGLVQSIAFSPDGQMLASGSSYPDYAIKLWGLGIPEQPALLSTLTGHGLDVSSVAFSPNGQVLASGSWDDTIKLWDISDPEKPWEFNGFTSRSFEVNSVAFSPNGQVLASSGGDGTIKLWDVNKLSWQHRACRKAGRNLTQDETEQYIPAQFRLQSDEAPVCPNFPYPAPESDPTDIETVTAHHAPVVDASPNIPLALTPPITVTRPVSMIVGTGTPTATASHLIMVTATPVQIGAPSLPVQPAPVACDSSDFWVSKRSSSSGTTGSAIQVQLPAAAGSLEMWLLVQGHGSQPPVVGSTPAQAVLTATHSISHSLWSAVVGPDIAASGVVTMTTEQPEDIIALFLIDAADNRVYALQPEECQASTQPVLECDPSSAGCVEQWIRQYLPLISKQ